MVCCVKAYGIYKINSQKIKRINKTEASVREPPAQVFSKRNLLQKTGQPTNGRLIERCGRARSSFPTLDLSLIYPLLDRNIEQKQLPRLDWRRRTRTVGILVHFCSKPSAWTISVKGNVLQNLIKDDMESGAWLSPDLDASASSNSWPSQLEKTNRIQPGKHARVLMHF